MCWCAWNKMIVVSSCMAAAGTLVCSSALLDVIVPKGAVFGFVVSMAALGVIIIIVVAGYVWICDKCEDYLSGRLDHLLSMEQQSPRGATHQGKKETRVPSGPDHISNAVHFPKPSASADHYMYMETRRGFARPKTDSPRAMSAEKRWHGQ